ncbi:MAG: phosphoribosyltransferase family protein [Bacteroidales bacterium]|nr:phosphoribosyltransferase family protein [Bacteroidales bacterium]
MKDFISIIFPRICAGCGNSLWKNEEVICHLCDYHLPRTNFHRDQENPVTITFRGRVHVESAAAYLYFNKGNKVQRLIHQLKYKGRKDIGVFLGNQYGRELIRSPFFKTVDQIIPVPLHKKKLMKRGYNQSEQIALGLSESMKIPVNKHQLIRIKATETQTHKSRFDRVMNVHEIFTVLDPLSLKGKHILLVDDVVTTGATLESCIQNLQNIPGIKISVACLATAVI